MRIAFNGQRLAGQPFGVGRYLEYLLRFWDQQLKNSEELTVFLRQPPPAWLTELGPRIRTRLLESKMSGIPWENLCLDLQRKTMTSCSVRPIQRRSSSADRLLSPTIA